MAPNCVWVRYGDLEVKYSHLRSGSIKFSPADLPQEVVAGQKLAEGGNSGNTSGSPHLHMECRVSSTHSNVDLRKTLCGFVFKRTWMVERSQIPTTGGNGPRVSLKAQGICQETAALRPFKPGLGPFGPVGLSDIELETLVAEVFGGVSKGGDGFAIVGGKIVKVPPRGIKFKLLQSVLDLDAIDQIGKGMSSQLTEKIENVIKEIRKELGKHGG